jgi:hypothetical protein
MMRVVEFAQHLARLDAAVDVPGALLGRQPGKELAAPGLDVGDHRLGHGRVEDARHGQVADMPEVGQVRFAQFHHAVVQSLASAPAGVSSW